MSCSRVNDGAVVSSNAPLVTQSTIWYPNAVPSPSHAGSVSTVVANGSYCVGAEGTSQITSAWEARPADSSGRSNSIWWSIGCPFANGPAQLSQQIDSGTGPTGTGTPPEWTSPETMVWLGQPHLLPIRGGQPGWVALVGLVGVADDDTTTAHNIGIALSENGGQTWMQGTAHLLAPITGGFGGMVDMIRPRRHPNAHVSAVGGRHGEEEVHGGIQGGRDQARA